MNLLLKAKHWQLFLLMFLPLVVSSGVLVYYYIDIIRHMSQSMQQYTSNVMIDFTKLIGAWEGMTLCGLFSLVIYSLWMCAVNINLRKKLSPSLRDSKTRFAIIVAIPILYSLTVAFTIYYLFGDILSGLSSMQNPSGDSSFSDELMQKGKIFLPINLSLYILTIPSILYLSYRTGKTFKKLEQKTEVKVSDYITEIILVLFFPVVGIWLLQPKVNKYVELKDFDESLAPPPSPIL